MIGVGGIRDIGARLATRSGSKPLAVYDVRIDSGCLDDRADPELLRHVRHQLLLRAYQTRYLLLPSKAPTGSILEHLVRHYDATELGTLEQMRPILEAELIAPMVTAARRHARDVKQYVDALLLELRSQPENPFTAWLAGHPAAEHHYKNFLMQSSADLLAEASASALGIVGEFGPVQSALFRILIDEFGYGSHGKKHSVLYRATLRSFELVDEYNAYWPFFDTVTLELHNVIHHLFQNPRNFFMQVGFLLFAETAYQRSTADHHRFLSAWRPQADARYFAEHAHIDLHHARMVVDEVIAPLIQTYGTEVGHEIVAGAELTRAVFAASGAHLLAVGQAFDAAARAGRATYGVPASSELGDLIAPSTAASHAGARVQVGGIGVLCDAIDFAIFPTGAIGRGAFDV